MKFENTDEDKYTNSKTNGYSHQRSFNYLSNTTNFGEDFADLYNVTNNISRVELYPPDYYEDQESKPLMLLNLDNHNKRKASSCRSDYGSDEPASKTSLFSDYESDDSDVNGWRNKSTEQWESTDTTNWLIHAGQVVGHSYRCMPPQLAMTGKQLLQLNRQDFIYYDRMFGEKLYDFLHHARDSKNFLPPFDTLQKSSSDDETSLGCGIACSDGESVKSSDSRKKRPIGRPRSLDPKKKTNKVKLWEFIRNLLLNPKYCPVWICWENYDIKRFRFVQSDSVAKLWGERKNNKNMTYEKFSRAMRYYYPKKIFVAVPGRRLVYDFGEKAHGLETSNPNFDPNHYKSVGRSK